MVFGQGDNSLFALRSRELAAAARADQTIEENVAIQRSLDRAVATLVGDAEKSMQSGSSKLVEDLARNRMLLLIVAAMSVLVAIAIGVFYVQRRLVRRLTSVGDAMRRLSSGETDLSVPAAADRDEIGDMARSLEVFRAGEIDRREMAQRREAEQAAQRGRAAGIEQMIGDFRATVTAVIAAVTDNVSRMETTARTLSSIAAEADNQARAASQSSEQTSSNVRSVAGATEELGASILEISDQASQANGVVGRASEIAQNADQLVGQLSSGAAPHRRRGEADPRDRRADQPAGAQRHDRGGARGRSGARLCGRRLARSRRWRARPPRRRKRSQRKSARSRLRPRRRSRRSARFGVMGDISRFTSTIAASVEEQSASTQEIGRNVHEAATGAKELAGNMATVTEAIEETNRSATHVLEASSALTSQAGTLQQAVDEFLDRVAAACTPF